MYRYIYGEGQVNRGAYAFVARSENEWSEMDRCGDDYPAVYASGITVDVYRGPDLIGVFDNVWLAYDDAGGFDCAADDVRFFDEDGEEADADAALAGVHYYQAILDAVAALQTDIEGDVKEFFQEVIND